MDEFLGSVIAAIADLLFELFLELIGEAVVSLLARALGSLFSAIQELSTASTAVGVAALGAMSGALSLAIFPHPLVHSSRFHGVSLLISPLLTGLVMSQIGRMLRNCGQRTTAIESFEYGFLFALAMALVRFLSVG